MNDPPEPAGIEMISEAMRAYEFAPVSELKLTSSSEALQAINFARTIFRQGLETYVKAQDNLSHDSV